MLTEVGFQPAGDVAHDAVFDKADKDPPHLHVALTQEVGEVLLCDRGSRQTIVFQRLLVVLQLCNAIEDRLAIAGRVLSNRVHPIVLSKLAKSSRTGRLAMTAPR